MPNLPRKDYKTSDFPLRFAKENLIWGAAPRPGLPLQRWPDGTLCEPLLFFFAYSLQKKRVQKASSLKPEAYALRQWLVFLANNGLTLSDVSDNLMEQWRTNQGWVAIPKSGGKKAQLERRAAKKNVRIERKLHVVYEFYRILPEAMPFEDYGVATPRFVGEVEARNSPITTRNAWSKKRKCHYPIWSQAEKTPQSPTEPRVPSPEQVRKLYSFLRGSAFRKQMVDKKAVANTAGKILADRNWLLARTMADGGLRCEEVEILTIEQIATAFYASGVTSEVLDLTSMKLGNDDKEKIKRRVLSLRIGVEHSFVPVEITGKGGKLRKAPFSLSLICDLLDFIWGPRVEQISSWSAAHNHAVVPRSVFLSNKSKNAIKANAIGSLLGAAFKACGLLFSAHDLRAHFATVTAASYWKDYFAANRYRFDEALVNTVMEQVATDLGHSQVGTTVKFYVSKPLFKILTKVGTKEADTFRKTYDIVVMGTRSISTRQSELIVNVTAKIMEAADDSLFLDVVEHAIGDERLHPSARPPRRGKPELAHSND